MAYGLIGSQAPTVLDGSFRLNTPVAAGATNTGTGLNLSGALQASTAAGQQAAQQASQLAQQSAQQASGGGSGGGMNAPSPVTLSPQQQVQTLNPGALNGVSSPSLITGLSDVPPIELPGAPAADAASTGLGASDLADMAALFA